MSFKNYGKNLWSTRGREVFFVNYLRLIRFIKVRGVCKCMRNKNGGGGFKVHSSQKEPYKNVGIIKKIIGKSWVFFPNYFEVVGVTRTLNNSGKIDRRGGKIILNL